MTLPITQEGNTKVCIYHGNCADGFGAAWAVWKRHGYSYDYYPGVYQEVPPDVSGKDLLIVDFSYKRPVMEELIASAKSVTILDHHKTAAEDLSELMIMGKLNGIFDQSRSGAMITWDTMFPGKPAPELIKHIQDRDLWKFKLPGTREIQSTIFSYEYDFQIWDTLMTCDPQLLIQDGEAIDRKHMKDIRELLAVVRTTEMIGGYKVPVANLPYTMSSEAGHIMAKGEAFAACYWVVPGARIYSLRSCEDGIDVSVIAKKYGGGGHKHAAGFKLEFGRAL